MRIQDDKAADLRKDYKSDTLSISEVDDNPIIQFQKWFGEAIDSNVLEPNAMTLATVGNDGWPSARVVLLKGFDENGFFFYTNYQSKKAIQMAENPRVALVFNWLELERQVRIEGTVALLEEDKSNQYYNKRPRGSRLGAWVSPQSNTIHSRTFLESRLENITALFQSEDQIPKPPFWGGYRVVPRRMEFWQGRSSRLHDRIVYHHHENHWHSERIAP